VAVWNITAPDGQTLKLPVKPDRYYLGDPRKMKAPAMWTWLYKKHPGLPEQAKAVAEGGGLHEKKKAEQAKRKGFDPGTWGHCPVCDRAQKIRKNKMVLHGYERPGFGYIRGSCLGVKEPPYELSKEGCDNAARLYAENAKVLTAQARKKAKAKDLLVKDSYAAYRIRPDNSIEKFKRGTSEFKNAEIYLPYGWDEKKAWTTAVKAHQHEYLAAATQLKEEAKRMTKKSKAWKLKPLPGT
jgi:hypothetical protein